MENGREIKKNRMEKGRENEWMGQRKTETEKEKTEDK